MSICLSEISSKKKLFLGDFDPVKIANQEICFEQIMFDLKAAALLYDYILIPSAHFWQSDLVGTKISYFQDFIEANILFPTIRMEDRDLQDRFEKRLDETNKFKDETTLLQTPSLAGELTTQEQHTYLEQFHDSNQFVYLDKVSVSDQLRQLWVQDLCFTLPSNLDPSSFVFYICKNFSVPVAKDIIQQLMHGKDLEYISRTTLTAFSKQIFDTTVGKGNWDPFKVNQRISWLYLLAVAISSDCDLYVNGFHSSSPFVYANLDLYLRTLKSVGITPEIIRSISVNDIINIRHAKEYQIFIEIYRSLLRDTKIITDEQVEEIFKEINKNANLHWYGKALSKAQQFRDVCMGIATGLLVNYLGGTPLSMPIASMLSASIGILSTPVILNRIAAINRNTSVANFKKYMLINFSKQIEKQ